MLKNMMAEKNLNGNVKIKLTLLIQKSIFMGNLLIRSTHGHIFFGKPTKA